MPPSGMFSDGLFSLDIVAQLSPNDTGKVKT